MRRLILAAAISIALGAGSTAAIAQGAHVMPSPVRQSHIAEINARLRDGGIRNGFVAFDHRGRLELQGAFEDEHEVDAAFSIAQTVVGVRWVSPVTPDNIKVKEWQGKLSELFLKGARSADHAPPSPPRVESEAASETAGTKYALVVGVGRFKHRIQPLQYANKDAYDVYAYLVDPAGGNFPRGNVILLRDENATRQALVKALDEIRQRARPADLVLLYFSSHGTPPDKFEGVHVVTHDSEVNPRTRIWDTSLTEATLRDFIERLPAQRLVVVMDACYSNGAYAQIAGFLPPGGKSLEAGIEEGYGNSQRYMAQRLLGAKDLVVDDAASAQRPRGARGGRGKLLISASDAGERSWESDELRNSVFTRYFLDGLKMSHGSVKEAFEHARQLVPRQVKREKGPDIEQHPQLTADRRDWNVSIAAR